MKTRNKQQIKILKKFLKEHTLIGEYLGGFFNQHITYEKEEKIVFYGISKKSTFENDIITFEKAAKAVEKLGFEFVKYEVFTGNDESI